MFSKAVFFTSTLAIAMAQIPAPTCYTTGTGGALSCAQFISNFCNDVANNVLRAGNSGGRCYVLNSTTKCDFVAFNSGPQMAPSEQNCEIVLNNIANVCPMGGFGRVQNTPVFTFTLDPNAGACSQNLQASTKTGSTASPTII